MQSYSQSGQDIYALEKSGGKVNGFYIEIGAHDPLENSNSLMLENIGWNGISFEISDISSIWNRNRKNKIVICDATNYDFMNCFLSHNVPQEIDYLSLDIDGATLDCLKKLPLQSYVFKVITIEHDDYFRGSEIKNAMREILNSHGYSLDKPDVASNGFVYEDWWLH